jgi:uncharacterized protein (TIGR00255 family)
MIKSMTGFGNSEAQTNNFEISIEVKTLNSKFQDLSLRLSRVLNAKEIEIRNIINDELIRGKISLSIQINEGASESKQLFINRDLFQSYYNQLKELELVIGRPFNDILKIALESPDVLKNNENSGVSEEEFLVVKETLNLALAECNQYRLAEGNTIATVLKGYVSTIEKSLDIVNTLEPNRISKIREKLKTNISEIVGSVNYDKDRLEQELIYYSEKLDINEEMERLKIHLNYFNDTILSEANSHGKKLGFITQEMGREINTLGSKANDSAIQEQVILMKEELEKIKEQILNVL